MGDVSLTKSTDNLQSKANVEASPFDAYALYETAASSTVHILSYPPGILGRVSSYLDQIGLGFIVSVGSGFFVEHGEPNNCEVATANHVLGQNKATAYLQDGQVVEATIEKRDVRNDIAILRLYGVKDPAKACKALQLDSNPETPKSGEFALMISNVDVSNIDEGDWPAMTILQAAFLTKRYTRRISTSTPGEDLNRDMFVFTGQSLKGMSGAPILNSDGKVTEIVQAGSSISATGAPAHYLQEDLDQLGR